MTFILNKKEYNTEDPDLFAKLRKNKVHPKAVVKKFFYGDYKLFCENYACCFYCGVLKPTGELIKKNTTFVCKEHLSEYSKRVKTLQRPKEKTTLTYRGVFYDFKDLDKDFKALRAGRCPLRVLPPKYKEQYKLFRENHERCVVCKEITHKDFLSKRCCNECLGTKYDEYIKNINEKVRKTNLERFGETNYFKTQDFREKMITKRKLEGNKKVKPKKKIEPKKKLSKEEITQKIKQTCLEKYGVDNVFKLPEIQEKIKQKNREKYGVDYPFQSKEIQDKIKHTYKERGIENISQLQEVKDKVRKTNLEKYGCPVPSQQHIRNYENYNIEYVKNNFVKDGWFLRDEFLDYFGVSENCLHQFKNKHNITEPNKINKHKTQSFIFNNIKTENKILNDKSILNGVELDIYLPDIKLAIEYNGLKFHSQGTSEYSMFNTPNFNKTYHLKKTELCNQNGIQLFHIFEGEDLDLWLSIINNKLNKSKKIFARKCQIKELNNKETKEFLNNNHIQGYCAAKINLGLYYNNELVQLMTFSKPRFNKKYEYELIRLCSTKNTTVVGGPSKLLSYFKKVYEPKSIISYANRRFSNGSIYETLGFKLISKSEPNYFYFKANDTKLESRNKYQKHKLKNLLDKFDPKLSEPQNMFNNDYRRIFDCGNLVYELIFNINNIIKN